MDFLEHITELNLELRHLVKEELLGKIEKFNG
jgi:hypothetical protein